MESMHTPAFLREYLAVCEGIVQEDRGRICAPIGREAGSGLRRCVRPDGSPSQEIEDIYGDYRDNPRRRKP